MKPSEPTPTIAADDAAVKAATYAALAVDVGPGAPDPCCSIKDYPHPIAATCYLDYGQMEKVVRAALATPSTTIAHFEFTDECALTMRPSSKPGYETLSIYEGETALKIRLTPEAKDALAATIAPFPDREVLECTEHCSFRDREHTHYRNTVHVAPSPTIAAPSPSNEVTAEMVEAGTYAALAVDVGPGAPDPCCSIRDYPHPVPATCYLCKDQMEKVVRVAIEAAMKARKPADGKPYVSLAGTALQRFKENILRDDSK